MISFPGPISSLHHLMIDMLCLQHTTRIDAASFTAQVTPFQPSISSPQHLTIDMLCLQHTTSIHTANQYQATSRPFLAVDFEPVSSHDRHPASSTRNTDPRCQFLATSHFSPAVNFEPILSRDSHALCLHTQHIRSECYVCGATNPTSQSCSTACHQSTCRCPRCPSSLRCPWSLKIPRCFTWRGPWASPPQHKSYCPEAGASKVQVVSTVQYDHG